MTIDTCGSPTVNTRLSIPQNCATVFSIIHEEDIRRAYLRPLWGLFICRGIHANESSQCRLDWKRDLRREGLRQAFYLEFECARHERKMMSNLRKRQETRTGRIIDHTVRLYPVLLLFAILAPAQ